METRRDDKKTQKLASEIDLTGLRNYFTENRMPKDDQILDRKAMKENIQKHFNKDNEKLGLQVKKDRIFGNNNTVVIPDNSPFAIVMSETRQTAANVNTVFSSLDNPAPWLPKEWRTETVTGSFYQKEDIDYRKNYDAKFNHFEEGKSAGNFLSITITECFPNSLDRLAKNNLSDEERIKLACDMGQQIGSLLTDLEKQSYIWSDLKTGNIMLRDDNSIVVTDKKAFIANKDILVKTSDLPYQKDVVSINKDFNPAHQIVDNRFYYKVPESIAAPFEFQVKNVKGEIIHGSLDNEALKRQFDNDDNYNIFRANLAKRKPLTKEDLRKIYSAANESYGTLTEAYFAENPLTTPGFISAEFAREKRYSSASIAREAYIDDMHKEYSYQLAAVLYTTLTGDENKLASRPLDFSQSVFQSPDGQQFKSMIENMIDPNPNNRISFQQAMAKLNEIHLPVERKIEAEPEVVKKSTSTTKQFIRRASQSNIIAALKQSAKKEPSNEIVKPSEPNNAMAKEPVIEQTVELKKSVSINESLKINNEGPARTNSARSQEGNRYKEIQNRAKIDIKKTPLAKSEANTNSTTPTFKKTT